MLAGGGARRLGGAGKAHLPLAGRPLIDWALDALTPVLDDVAVVAKAATTLPPLPPGVQTWIEPDEPRHPLTGLQEALSRAGGAPVIALAVDLPLVRADTVEALLPKSKEEEEQLTVIARAAGRWQPLLARYPASALPALREAPPGAPLTQTVLALAPRALEVPQEVLLNVNDEADLRRAQRLISRR